MTIIDEILPKVKAEVRLDKANKTLWIKTDTLDGYGRIIIEDGANWCRIFYEECGECAHNEAEPKDEPQTELVNDSPILVKDLVDDEFNPYDEECMRCKHLKLKCEFVPSYCKYEPRDEPQTELKGSKRLVKGSDPCDGCIYYSDENVLACVACVLKDKQSGKE